MKKAKTNCPMKWNYNHCINKDGTKKMSQVKKMLQETKCRPIIFPVVYKHNLATFLILQKKTHPQNIKRKL